MRKKIGITLRIVKEQNYDEIRDALSHDWVPFLEQIDFTPILIPNNLCDVNSFLKDAKFDGFILSGGDNRGDNPLRDNTEDKIIKFGIQNKIPIFGVCRGIQVLNEHFEGSIEKNQNDSHVGNMHLLKLNEEYTKILDAASITVNSFHHNIIREKDVSKEFESFAVTKDDNTIEGFHHKSLPIIGVMWHPERETKEHDKLLVKNFFDKR